MSSEPILLCAPGGGLGHVTRACAIALALRERGVAARIVSSSRYAEGLGRLTGLAIDAIPSSRWAGDLPEHVKARAPRLAVLDTFPWGLRGEWIGVLPSGVRFVHLARRLKVNAYLDALELAWDPGAPQLERVIIAEPLADGHAELLAQSGGEMVELPGRIRFPLGVVEPPVPPQLDRLLKSQPTWLIVHSGPRAELDALVEAAEADRDGEGALAAVVPEPPSGLPCPCFEYFPAAALFPRARRIVTAAGYNLMAEAAPFADRHLAVPFPRRYDDQPARLAGPPAGTLDGTPHAAQALAEWV